MRILALVFACALAAPALAQTATPQKTQTTPAARTQPARQGVSAAQQDARRQQIARAAEALQPRLVEIRRELHMHPELSNREERTSRAMVEHLRKLGFTEIRTGVAKHGVVALLRGGRPGPVVAVRADMDALPIEGTLDVPYRSRNQGVKHACGHDVHMTVQLGVAEILAGMREQLAGTIMFVFQPAEEGPPPGEEGGASLMIEEGVFANPRPAAIFGLHVMPDIEAGRVAVRPGGIMASSDTWTLTITGKGAHGSAPHLGLDPIPVAAEAIQALQTIRSRRITTFEPLVITVGKIQGGERHNIIASEVRMDGTLRTLDEDVRARAKELMVQVLDGVTRAHGASYKLEWQGSNYVTANHPQLAEFALASFRRTLGEAAFEAHPIMAAEDFAEFQREIPGVYYFLGVGNQEKGITAGLHTAEFDVDESAIAIGVRAMANLVLDFLEQQPKLEPVKRGN